MPTFLHVATLAFGAALLARSAPAQGEDALAPGLALDSAEPLSAGLHSAFATLPNGDKLVFDGADVFTWTPGEAPDAPLATLPSFGWPSFVRLAPDASFAVLGESTHGGIWRVALPGGALVRVATIVFNFDAVLADAGTLLVSAAPCGFGCGTDVRELDLASGVDTLRANLPGPSGPLAVAPDGDLVLTLQSDPYPSPPGSVSILRFTAAQLAGPATLGLADAEVVLAGLDGCAALAFDPRDGALFFSEASYGSASLVRRLPAGGVPSAPLVVSRTWVSRIELVDLGGAGTLQPFQPQGGVALCYQGTDFDFATTREVRVVPAQPQARVWGTGLAGPGRVHVTVTGARPGAVLRLVSAPVGSLGAPQTLDLGWGFPLHTPLPASAFAGRTVPAVADEDGTATWSYANRGALHGTLAHQALLETAPGAFEGASTCVTN